MLITFGGLPGTGKTTIAKQLSRRISATYLRIDTLEQGLRTIPDFPEKIRNSVIASPILSPKKTFH